MFWTGEVNLLVKVEEWRKWCEVCDLSVEENAEEKESQKPRVKKEHCYNKLPSKLYCFLLDLKQALGSNFCALPSSLKQHFCPRTHPCPTPSQPLLRVASVSIWYCFVFCTSSEFMGQAESCYKVSWGVKSAGRPSGSDKCTRIPISYEDEPRIPEMSIRWVARKEVGYPSQGW